MSHTQTYLPYSAPDKTSLQNETVGEGGREGRTKENLAEVMMTEVRLSEEKAFQD